MNQPPKLVLLPGLDGSSSLGRRFVAAGPPGLTVLALPLPRESFASYSELADRLQPSLPAEPFVLIGNSFSGPLALNLARRVQPLGLVLCATFVRAPAPQQLFVAAPLSFLMNVRPSTVSASVFLTGGDIELAAEVVEAVGWLRREVVASRLRLVLGADAAGDLAGYRGPVLYLRATGDLVVSERQRALLQELRPDAVCHDVEAPHLILQASPRLSWQHIVNFMKSLHRPGARDRLSPFARQSST